MAGSDRSSSTTSSSFPPQHLSPGVQVLDAELVAAKLVLAERRIQTGLGERRADADRRLRPRDRRGEDTDGDACDETEPAELHRAVVWHARGGQANYMTGGAWGSWGLVLMLIALLVGMYLASRLLWGTIWPYAPW